MQFKFVKQSNKYIWSNENIKIEYSNPSVQSFNDLETIESEKDIMYYYYTISIFKKIFKRNRNDNDEKDLYQWKLISTRNTHDFPCITQLQWILEEILKLDTVIGGEKHSYRSGKEEYSKTYHSEGFACDDFYEITKYTDKKGLNPNYIVYIGCAIDFQGDLNSTGVRIPYISEKEINELLLCVNAFIQYSIDLHNIQTAKYVETCFKRKEIKGNKIYEYSVERNNNINKNKIENIYIIGDNIDIDVYKKDGEVYKKEDLNNLIITNISGNEVSFSNGITYSLEEIGYVSDNIYKEKLKYNIDEITDDFFKLFSEEENKDFCVLSVDELMEKYHMAIINRTCMCREEHNFPRIHDDNIENAKEQVIDIIKKIKMRI